MTDFIVAEISKNWQGPIGQKQAEGDFISKQFEKVIEHNRKRGYELHSFQLNRIMTGPEVMNETIVAVFKLCHGVGRC